MPPELTSFDREAPPVTLASLETATSIEDVELALSQLHAKKAQLTEKLVEESKRSNQKLTKDFQTVNQLGSLLSTRVDRARATGKEILTEAASSASRLSTAVRKLDQEQANVKATLEVVEQIVELKECTIGLHNAMEISQNWERAAQYISRISMLPSEVVDSTFAQQVVATANVPDPPRIALQNASDALSKLFLREFEKSARDMDNANITKYFKLFPLIGRQDVGLSAYGRYVSQGITSRARENISARPTQISDPITRGVFYVNSLTLLFEHIAQIVEQHRPIVETHYGQGRMLRVAERLQTEIDIQGGLALDSWFEETNVERLLHEIDTHSFSGLSQLYTNPSLNTGPAHRLGSPAVRNGSIDQEDDSKQSNEVESMLLQCTNIINCWNLYVSFLASRASPDEPTGDAKEADPDSDVLHPPKFMLASNLHRKVTTQASRPFKKMIIFFLRRSIERAFRLDETPAGLSIRQQKSLPLPPYRSTLVDDIMFILSQVVQRVLATSDASLVKQVLAEVGHVLNRDVIEVIHRKMRNECYPRQAVQGQLPPEDTVEFIVQLNNLAGSIEYVRKIVSGVLNPPAAVAKQEGNEPAQEPVPGGVDYLRLKFPLLSEAEEVLAELRRLEAGFTAKAHELLSNGLLTLYLQAVEPNLWPIVNETFRGAAYDGDDVAAAVAAAADPASSALAGEAPAPSAVQAAFDRLFPPFISPVLRILHPDGDQLQSVATDSDSDDEQAAAATRGRPEGAEHSPAHRLLILALTSLAELVEKRIWMLAGRVTPLGALALDRDVAAIAWTGAGCAAAVGPSGAGAGTGPLSVSAPGAGAGSTVGQYYFVSLFLRCSQIVMVVAMDPEEWAESGAGAAVGEDGDELEWVLTAAERKRAREMLVD